MPRLGGKRVGVFATRTPHRPCPIGLSAARILDVSPSGGWIELGGADVVNGTPILDMKPYVPYSDTVAGAAAPDWVVAEREGEDEPLRIDNVIIDAGMRRGGERGEDEASLCPRFFFYSSYRGGLPLGIGVALEAGLLTSPLPAPLTRASLRPPLLPPCPRSGEGGAGRGVGHRAVPARGLPVRHPRGVRGAGPTGRRVMLWDGGGASASPRAASTPRLGSLWSSSNR